MNPKEVVLWVGLATSLLTAGGSFFKAEAQGQFNAQMLSQHISDAKEIHERQDYRVDGVEARTNSTQLKVTGMESDIVYIKEGIREIRDAVKAK